MEKKMVRYNGGTMSYYDCSEPTVLVIGKEYEVIAEDDLGWQTNYTLEGVDGSFNSVWFNELQSTDAVFMALAHKIPVVGEKCQCSIIAFVDGQATLVSLITHVVKEVTYMGHNIYHMTTSNNSVYIVQVG